MNDLEDDEKGSSVGLKMNAHGYAWLTIFEADKKNEIGEIDVDGKIVDYSFPPNETGWNNATMIAKALMDWVSTDNIPAINLYKKYGFMKLRCYTDHVMMIKNGV